MRKQTAERNTAMAVILTAIVTTLVVGAGSYLFFSTISDNKYEEDSSLNQEVEQNINENNSNEEELIETAEQNHRESLKIYYNNELGFEFRYPQAISLDGEINANDEDPDLYFCNEVSCFMSPDFLMIQKTTQTDLESLEFNYNTRGSGGMEGISTAEQTNIEQITLGDGTPAVRVDVNNGQWIWIQFFDDQDNLYSFLVNNWKDENLEQIIIDTFRFE